MLKVLVVDDEMLARDELKYLLQRTKEVSVIDEADCVEDALEKLMGNKPDLVFLDIQLSDDSGFEIANILKKMKNPPAIVFATAYDQYALQAFEVDALDYILKPFDEERILQTLKKYKKRQQSETEKKPDMKVSDVTTEMHKLALPIEESIVLVNIEDIVYVGLVDGRVTVKTIKETYVTHDTLVILEKKLPQMTFMRVHRGFIVNINHISEVQPWFNSTYNLTMKDNSKVPVSRTYAKELKKLLRI
ncbi:MULTISPECIES: LytR/AlgR family response regulator transcription factor [Bacillus cereus group]|uniref:DNA-binding response regulator n=1 Tax=Bacillus cereus TaxID=1396 RepID=A0AA44TG76_BACCE|nr:MULTISPECIES: LytTR family transcriptional regulator DNA-binding domain-containing protein [Bacillus cereus group]PFA20543.1 DNA-binding response regulator [Bacillus cereus]PFN05872.1 DNA-binding response regulator [Bacillus cereus]PFO82680.1 DNA-binding response regulator [Bacillus cereus]PFR32452.1 DNA-binding response regulator [Bacillus cereus]PFS06351.1 DNA-binding response regulator [Bacillus cereus]